MKRALIVVVVLALAVAATATAGRIGRSPYVFSKADVAKAPVMFRQQMRTRFGSSAKVSMSCRGRYPGTHGGVVGFHEIHCTFLVVALGAVGKSGSVTYWIDMGKHARETTRWD
jgi:hypothetical protein